MVNPEERTPDQRVVQNSVAELRGSGAAAGNSAISVVSQPTSRELRRTAVRGPPSGPSAVYVVPATVNFVYADHPYFGPVPASPPQQQTAVGLFGVFLRWPMFPSRRVFSPARCPPVTSSVDAAYVSAGMGAGATRAAEELPPCPCCMGAARGRELPLCM